MIEFIVLFIFFIISYWFIIREYELLNKKEIFSESGVENKESKELKIYIFLKKYYPGIFIIVIILYILGQVYG